MAQPIYIKCPVTGKPIKTMMATSDLKAFETNDVQMNVTCPYCGISHPWNGKGGFFQEEEKKKKKPS